jgi:phage-related minor tail protein
LPELRLEALHSNALRGFVSGGYVGDAPAVRRPTAKAGSVNASQTIAINAPVTVNTNGGRTPQQNADLAARMRKELEGTMRGVVMDEIVKRMRPGNMLSGRR